MESQLKVRLITAGILIAGLLSVGTLAAYYPFAKWLVLVICYIAVGLVCFEYSKLCSKNFNLLFKGMAYLTALLLPVTLQFFFLTVVTYEGQTLSNDYLLLLLVGGIIFSLFLFWFQVSLFSRTSLDQVRVLTEDFPIGLIFSQVFGSCLMIIASFPVSYHYLLWLLLVVCLNDTAAYFAGKRFQGPKLSPVISPNKTISGSVAGILVGVLVGALCQGLLGFRSEYVFWFILFVIVMAQLGDLLKSYVKRLHGIKDTGQILPGHGGVLDRIDGVLAASAPLLLWLIVGPGLL